MGILELTRRRQEKWLNKLERKQDDRITRKVFMERLKVRDLEEGRGKDGLTILNKNLPLGYRINYDHFCGFHSYMDDLQH